MGFTRYKLSNVISDIHSGGTPSTSNSEYWNGEFKWLSSGETSQRFIFDTIDRITQKGIDESSTKLAKKGCVVMACAGQGKTRGQVSLLLDDMYINQSVIAIEANKEYLINEYLFYNLANRYEELRGGSDASSIRGSITTTTLKNLSISLPNVEEQQKTVDVLLKFDELIGVNNQRIKKLEQMAEELYKEWFVRFRFPNWQNTEFENGIPKGWMIKRLSDFGRIETGKTPSTENSDNYGEKYMFVKTPDMHGNTFVIQTEEMLSEIGNRSQPKKLLPTNSIMVSCIGTAGVVAITTNPSHTNQQINSLILNDLSELEWLYQTCVSLRPSIVAFGATGATMTNLSKGKFERLKVIYPTRELVNEYHVLTQLIFDRIKTLLYCNQNLIKQRDLLLPRLMSGKLEV